MFRDRMVLSRSKGERHAPGHVLPTLLNALMRQGFEPILKLGFEREKNSLKGRNLDPLRALRGRPAVIPLPLVLGWPILRRGRLYKPAAPFFSCQMGTFQR